MIHYYESLIMCSERESIAEVNTMVGIVHSEREAKSDLNRIKEVIKTGL